MNAVNFISPYKWNGQWVFDDPERELIKEPFVAGADTLLDWLTNNSNECKLTFSKSPFPGYQQKVEFVEPQYEGSIYYSQEYDFKFWLCPALFKYFKEAPNSIYLKVN